VAREKAKVVRDQKKAEKVDAIVARKAELNTKKLQPKAQTGKRKASQAFSPKPKPKKHTHVAAAHAALPEAAPVAPPKVNCRSRTISVPSKYRLYKQYSTISVIALLKDVAIISVVRSIAASFLWW
jgi:hypothetical protein